ncbi:BnaA01g31250D [Brassica napus]|uniref:mannosyl-glycoprotein endo-beta-N-acetylglucosaminidase n=1 Tax=Brassica napus TaxID=3708 RepID=A0A078HHL1_BRANA|nr:BnaA01g31250D [Brassica napus]
MMFQESYPKLSAEVAGDRKYDVYMGIDVFGRGSFGGGQWTVDTALDLLKRNNVSAAIFAPGWVYETAQPPNFHTAQNKWWSLVEKSWGVVQTYPQVLPFYSDFNQVKWWSLVEKSWGLVQTYPQVLPFYSDFNQGFGYHVSLEEASYNGGGNIVFKGRLDGDVNFTARLFKPLLHLSSSPITVSYSVKSDETSKLGLLLCFSSPSHETKSILVAPQEPTSRFDHMFLKCLVASKQTVSEWTVHETSLYVALLGHISIKDHVQLPQNLVSLPPPSLWVIDAHNMELVTGDSGSKILRVKLEWRQTQLEDSVLPVYNVYAESVKSTDVLRSRKVLEKPRSERVFVGVSHVPAYYVSELVVDSDVKGVSFVVQPCGEDGSWMNVDVSPNHLVDLEGLS